MGPITTPDDTAKRARKGSRKTPGYVIRLAPKLRTWESGLASVRLAAR